MKYLTYLCKIIEYIYTFAVLEYIRFELLVIPFIKSCDVSSNIFDFFNQVLIYITCFKIQNVLGETSHLLHKTQFKCNSAFLLNSLSAQSFSVINML